MKVKHKTTRNSHRPSVNANRVHKTRTSIPYTHISKSRNTRVAKHTILIVIVAASLAVLAYTIFTIIATPEYIIKRQIESIVADYYENYFYENNILDPNNLTLNDVKDSASAEASLKNILENYLETGFSRITLNQLLLSNGREHYSSAGPLSKYCNLNTTTIKIYPVSPYTKKDYRVDYNYSCNF